MTKKKPYRSFTDQPWPSPGWILDYLITGGRRGSAKPLKPKLKPKPRKKSSWW